MTTFERLEDDSPMPFGIHKNERMDQVPAKYLDYIHGKEWIKRWPSVLDYIERNRDIIDYELELQNNDHED